MNTEYRFLNNNDYAADFRQKINDNFADLYKNNVPKNHESATNIYGVGSTSTFGHLKVQASNGLGVANGVISLTQATANSYGAVRLATSASSASSTDVVTSQVLRSALRDQNSAPRIYYGSSSPSSSNTPNSQDGDIYIRY